MNRQYPLNPTLTNLWDCCFPHSNEDIVMIEDEAKRARYSPADWLGRRIKCCFCIPMRAASILICIMSFFWVILEMQGSKTILPVIMREDGEYFIYFKLTYIVLAIIFLSSTGVLMLGIIAKNCNALNAYVWAAFIFNCVVMSVYLAAIVSMALEAEFQDQLKTIALAALFVVVYHVAVFYCIAVVNSYEIYLRMLSLNEGLF